MSTREILSSVSEPRRKAEKDRGEVSNEETKHPLSNEVKNRAHYVNRRMSEYFSEHGLPDPVDFTETVRTLKSVFSADHSEETSQKTSDSRELSKTDEQKMLSKRQ